MLIGIGPQLIITASRAGQWQREWHYLGRAGHSLALHVLPACPESIPPYHHTTARHSSEIPLPDGVGTCCCYLLYVLRRYRFFQYLPSSAMPTRPIPVGPSRRQKTKYVPLTRPDPTKLCQANLAGSGLHPCPVLSVLLLEPSKITLGLGPLRPMTGPQPSPAMPTVTIPFRFGRDPPPPRSFLFGRSN